MKALYSVLGSVCERCEVFSDPGVLACSACGATLAGARWVASLDTKPPPVAAPSLTYMGKAPSVGGEISAGPPVLQRTPGPSAIGPAPSGAPPLGTPGPSPYEARGTPGPARSTPGPAPHPSFEGPPRGPALHPPHGTPGPLPPVSEAARAQETPGPAPQPYLPTPGPPLHPPGGSADRSGQTIHGTPGPNLPGLAKDPHTSDCPRCGKPHPLRTRFCPNCGLKLGADLASRAPGARLQQGSASLMLLRGMGASGSSFRLADEVTQLGRTAGLIRFPSDDTLSPLAASFIYRGGRLYVRDEGGPSGIFLRLLLPSVLLPNDWFSIGDKLLRFLGRVPPPHPEPTTPRHLGSMRMGSGPLLRIQLVHLGGVGGRVFALPAPVRIGRALGEVIFGDDPFISTRHCELDVDPAGAVIRDLGSSNGTFIRLPPGSERELGPGDTIRLGRNILRVDR